MPDNSKTTIAFNDTASSLTDAPISYGILTILKLNPARRQIIITQSTGYVNSCTEYRGGRNETGDGIVWNRAI